MANIIKIKIYELMKMLHMFLRIIYEGKIFKYLEARKGNFAWRGEEHFCKPIKALDKTLLRNEET